MFEECLAAWRVLDVANPTGSLQRTTLSTSVITVALGALCVVWLVPLWMLVINASKSAVEYQNALSPWTFPQHPSQLWSNLSTAWTAAQLRPGFLASLGYGVGGAALGVACAGLGAYALVNLGIKFKFLLFALVLSGLMFPLQMYFVPLFQLYHQVGLYDTHIGMLLFYAAISVPFCLFVLRAFFSTVPKEIYEAARLDGAGEVSILVRVYLPLARRTLAVLFLFQFTWIWNDLVFGLVLSASDGVRPLAASLASLQDQFATTGLPVSLAGALIGSAPTVLLFLVLARSVMTGLTLSSGSAKA